MKIKMISRSGAALVVMSMLVSAPPALAATALAPARGPGPAPGAGGPPPSAPSQPGSQGSHQATPQISQDAVARARMHECGHQWSAIKKAGTAGTMTWKDFSATCLVVSK